MLIIRRCDCCGFAAHCCCCCCLPKWGSPGPTSRCRGVSLWCTGPTRAPLKIHHYQLFYFSMILITSLALPRSSRSSRHFACYVNLAARLFRAQPNILFSFIHYSMPRISHAAQYLVVTQNGRSKKIGKRRGPAEQVARQTWYLHVDTTGLASPEVNTMRQQLKLAASKRK